MTDDTMERSLATLPVVIGTGITTVVLGSALAYAIFETRYKPKPLDNTNGIASKSNNAVNGDEKLVDFDKEKYPGGQLFVYYATQTGTAESFARQLEREGPDHGFFVHVADLEDTELEKLVNANNHNDTSDATKAIFLASTYGEGEPPDTAAHFVNILRERANMETLHESSKEDMPPEDKTLQGLEYCVFGLGNKQYEHYNAMGKFFDYSLKRVGASRILPIGQGNEDEDLEADFDAWKEKMWQKLESKYLANSDVLKEVHLNAAKPTLKLPDCPFVVEYHDASAKRHMTTNEAHHAGRTSNTAVRHSFTAVDVPVTVARELRTSEDPGSTVHMELDISGSGLSYMTADNLGVLALNRSDIVESVAKSLGYDLDQVFSLKAAPNHDWHGAPFPQPLSVCECLTRYCDLTGAPRRSDLKLLAEYTKDPIDREALNRMASKEGRTEYKEKVLERFVGIADILKLCPSIHMPLEHFLNVCPQLQTRYFTISSSSSVYPESVHITVAVDMKERKDGSIFKGICSNYLAECQPGKAMVRVFIRPSTFRLPEDATKPIIMIGPGTGVAPMRALLQERSHQKEVLKKSVGPNVLYFGCKTRSQDFLYKDELQNFQDSGILDQLYLAFSREQTEKVYVQYLLKQNASETWKLVQDQGAYIYVCGGVKMGHDVSEALKEIAMKEGKLNADKAKDYFANLTRDGRYVQELWA